MVLLRRAAATAGAPNAAAAGPGAAAFSRRISGPFHSGLRSTCCSLDLSFAREDEVKDAVAPDALLDASASEGLSSSSPSLFGSTPGR